MYCTLGQLTGDVDTLAEAVDVLAGTETRLEHARALVELGAALRRTNHRAEAREPLRDGLDLAIRLGATALRRQAVDELAAEGQTNRDIAQALFVTTKTVEVHLSACYRKLGITSRVGLAELLR